jgi:ankyrin repeat protein
VSHNAITLIAIVSPDGRVTKAHAVDGEKELFPRAEQIERARTFKPFTHKRQVVTAEIIDYVSVVGPEEWLFWHVPFPATVDLRTVTMSLRRTVCFGTCPDYTVSIAGSGLVTFDGRALVLLPGHHTAQVPIAAARDLFNAFRKAEFLSAKEDYVAGVTDNPAHIITLRFDGRTKEVTDYAGTRVGLPDAVLDLERQIDQTAGTERWIKGNEQSLASLKSEKWDFSSSNPDNMALYQSAIEHDDKELINAMVAAKAPIDIASSQFNSAAPVCAASGKGDIKLVHQMLRYQKTINKAALQPCLAAAARSGDLDLLNLWLARGANPLAPSPDQPRSGSLGILAEGVSSGKAAIVRRLLQYHPDLHQLIDDYTLFDSVIRDSTQTSETDDILNLLVKAGEPVNQRDSRGRTALFCVGFLSHPSAVKTLLALGASVNVRDNYGSTPLIAQSDVPEAVTALLDAGADPTALDKNGEGPL